MARPFADVLREMSGGRTYDEMSNELSMLVEEVLLNRNAGSITLTIGVKPNGEAAVVLTDKITVKHPVEKRGDSIFFVAQGGDLVRNDPRQREMFNGLKRVAPDGAAPAAVAQQPQQPAAESKDGTNG